MTTAQIHNSAQQIASSIAPLSVSAQSGTTSAGSTSSSTASSDITSNDFLTLLVSELKNQDPTQPTDPNAYVQQLVGVNSLQQLISINQGLTNLEDSSTTGTAAAGTSGTQQI